MKARAVTAILFLDRAIGAVLLLLCLTHVYPPIGEVIGNGVGAVLTATAAAVHQPGAACTMTFRHDACLDTSRVDDLR